MFPILSVLIAFVIALFYREGPVRPPPDVEATVALVVLVGLIARIIAEVGLGRAKRGGGESELIRLNLLVRGGAVGVHALVIYGLHWPGITDATHLGIEGWILIDDLVVMLPFFVMLTLCHAAAWSAESRLGLHTFRLRSYLLFQFQQYILPTAPLLVFLAVKDAARLAADGGTRWLAEARILYLSYPFVQWIALFLLLIVLYSLIPFLLRWVWRARPLPPGPLRDRLEEFSVRERFKARDILVWPTGGNILNAAVVGVAGPLRYVLLTDALIEGLEEDEVEAVFAHEAGHGRHNHMLLFLLFTLGFALFSYLSLGILTENFPSLARSETVSLLVVLGLMLSWFGLFFGFISRRFEQQADVFGLLSIGRGRTDLPEDPREHPFVRALTGLSDHMGDVKESKGWRHFSLSSRVEFLVRFLSDPGERKRFRVRIAQVLLIFFSILGALGASAAATIPTQVREGRAWAGLRRTQWLAVQNEPRAAAWEFALTLERTEEADLPHLVLSPLAEPLDPADLALELYDLRHRVPPVPLFRYFLETQLARTYESLGWQDEAREILFAALPVFGELPATFYLLGRSLEGGGLTEDARLAYEMALSVTRPDEEAARARIREVLAELPGAR